MIPVTKTFLPDLAEYEKLLTGIWASGQITNNGRLCQELTTRLSAYLGVTGFELVSNGTLAIQLAIRALGLSGEIITTPYSYVATTSAILWEGCKPVFVDIDENSFCLDPALIEAAITDKTSAILATHVYGYPCDVHGIQAVADRHGLKVIYDAAHAFGVRMGGRSVLEYGDCSTLSFHATKLFHTTEGGAVVCRDSAVAQHVYLMKKFGHIGEDEYLEIGINAKLSELHAAMGLALLPHIDRIRDERKRCSQTYDALLGDCGLRRPLLPAGCEYNYAYYPVVFPSHEVMMRVRQALLDNGIGPRRYFYPSLNTLPYLDAASRRICPVSESIADRVLSLPLYVDLASSEIEIIAGLMQHAVRCGEGGW
ncbi:MAG TPA: DegT/DnrJ/EryC1/StrS family aminotransferase [Spirochaetota bacterium]|nr:DegT/DnrJ/EryC1/StrS family aminotransferase [Spirochaetota bacterium]